MASENQLIFQSENPQKMFYLWEELIEVLLWILLIQGLRGQDTGLDPIQ